MFKHDHLRRMVFCGTIVISTLLIPNVVFCQQDRHLRLVELRNREAGLLTELEKVRAEIAELEREADVKLDVLGSAKATAPVALLDVPSLVVGKRLANLPKGTVLDVLLIIGGYAHARHEELDGYVFVGSLDSASVAEIRSRQETLEDNYQEAFWKALLSQGYFSDLQEKHRSMLLRVAKVAKPTDIGTEEFKTKRYLVVDLGAHPSIFNSLQLTGLERAARVVDEKYLAAVKLFGLVAGVLPGISGIKIVVSIPFQNFEYPDGVTQFDNLEIYTELPKIRAFYDASITSQQLLDSCVVLMNSNRIEVNLST
jgi:hypothetical protein